MMIILSMACCPELLECHGSENEREEQCNFIVGRGFGFQKGRIRNFKEIVLDSKSEPNSANLLRTNALGTGLTSDRCLFP